VREPESVRVRERKPRIACQLQRPLGGGCQEPTDDIGEKIGYVLRGKSRGVHHLKGECVGLAAQIRCPGGHLAGDEFRLVTALSKTALTFALVAVEEDGVYAPGDGVRRGGDVGWACLRIQDSYADRRVKSIQLEEPPLCSPRLPLLATAVLAAHYLRRWHADRIEVEAAHARNASCLERADRRGFANS